MIKSLSKFILEVLPSACATVIAGVLLSAYHGHYVGKQDIVDPKPTAEESAAPSGSEQPAKRVEAEHNAVVEPPREDPEARKPADAAPAMKPPSPRLRATAAKHPQLPKLAAVHPTVPEPWRGANAGSLSPPPTATVAAPLPMPSPPLPPPASSPIPPADVPSASAAPSAPEPAPAKVEEPKRVLGVTIPAPIVAIGNKLDPSPVVHAGEHVFTTIVVAAKSVVPDFGH